MRSTLRLAYEANLTALTRPPPDLVQQGVILEKLDAYNAGMSAKGEEKDSIDLGN